MKTKLILILLTPYFLSYSQILNPSFEEENFTNWEVSCDEYVELSSGAPDHGTYSARLHGGSFGGECTATIIKQIIPAINPGDTLSISVLTKSSFQGFTGYISLARVNPFEGYSSITLKSNEDTMWNMLKIDTVLHFILPEDKIYINLFSSAGGWPEDDTPSWNDFDGISINVKPFNHDNKLKNLIHVYPNPIFNEPIKIISHLDTDIINNIIVVDCLGKVVFSNKGYLPEIRINNLSAGVYFIKIETEIGNLIKTLIAK